MRYGIPELDIPPLEPFHLDGVRIDTDNPEIGKYVRSFDRNKFMATLNVAVSNYSANDFLISFAMPIIYTYIQSDLPDILRYTSIRLLFLFLVFFCRLLFLFFSTLRTSITLKREMRMSQRDEKKEKERKKNSAKSYVYK